MSANFALLALLIALALLGLAIVVIIILAYKYSSTRGQIAELARHQFEQWKAEELDFARRQFEQWREGELAAIKQQSLETARTEMQIAFNQWKEQYERQIRQDAIEKSRAVTLGKITEHFIPYLPDFPYNPKDARFIGSPVDFVVFDGLNEEEVRKVVFVEVKSGSSGLSPRERRVRDAVRSGHVEWREVRLSVKESASLPELGTWSPGMVEQGTGQLAAGANKAFDGPGGGSAVSPP